MLALVLLAVGGSAIGYYCYGPLLPEKTVRFDYHRGWLAAWRTALGGRYAYSFDRYMVEGLSDYALRKDGIAAVVVPTEIRWAPYFLAGFNSCMAERLKKKLACDFPDGYVKTYLEAGSLDVTKDQPVECPVHKRAMIVKEIPFEIVFPFTMVHPKSDMEVAGDAQFPYPDSTMKVDASWLARPRYARTRVCRDCGEAERQWLAENKPHNLEDCARPDRSGAVNTTEVDQSRGGPETKLQPTKD